ncbi:hypothetical protein PGTUg99_011554 [Puccinia graminis f. sp. tritici]|uniref:BD-FAE-like domain-containing protein n=1 Tax=Puccinia graminis f. sp. tritici TaxID=56615 RepID=A0A5B0MI79_PUCGR|nr:hypothetical protein PGTUg99_011554 [Puccinia graminis f. sp. tritici]
MDALSARACASALLDPLPALALPLPLPDHPHLWLTDLDQLHSPAVLESGLDPLPPLRPGRPAQPSPPPPILPTQDTQDHQHPSNWLELILDYSYRKIIVLGRNNSHRSSRPTIVCRDLIYAYSDDHHEHRPATRKRNQRLDVYLPTTSSSALAPVFLFIHPGGWRWFEKSLFLQIGLRFRRLGFCVVIPDFTQFPDGRCQDSVRDIRCVLRWVASSIREYGGDPERIFVAGHGSGAHLSMLTVVRSAIGRSLALQAYPSSVPPIFQQQEEEEEVPMIEGMILLSGIYDPINQLRAEARAGWLDILASRRALGPSHPSSLANSPAHLLHHALPFLEPRYLPAKFLIIHGGEDKNVPILQSHFLSTLLSTLTHPTHSSPSPSPSSPSSSESESSNESYNKHRGRIQVTFKPLKELDHLAALFALMIGDYAPLNSPPPTTTSGNPHSLPLGPPYSSIIVQQILKLVG